MTAEADIDTTIQLWKRIGITPAEACAALGERLWAPGWWDVRGLMRLWEETHAR
jgi:hypothetical protein